ncbi:MAG TPA: response regulator [Nitrospirota bacterium]|nr:response regulator [Nitrospirota bacterium]
MESSRTVTLKKQRYRTILVVDNKTQELLSLSLLLRGFEYDVLTANTAAQALELIAKAVPSLIITDVNLPGMSGMDLFQLLKQSRRTASVPVVFLLPGNDAASERRCLDMGAAGFISKPVEAENLYRTVQETIEPNPRADIRIDTRLPVSVNNVPLECPDAGCDIDLSEHGIYVPTHKPFPRNRKIMVQLHLKDQTLSIQGAVVHIHPPGGHVSKEAGMGLQFVKIAPQDQALIRTFIREEVTRKMKASLSKGAA